MSFGVPTAGGRAALRKQLLERRRAFVEGPRGAAAQASLGNHLKAVLATLEPQCLGVYGAMRSEFNAARLLRDDSAAMHWPLALPFARREGRSMHYRSWDGAATSSDDECGIPTSDGPEVLPDVVLVPCLGHPRRLPPGLRRGLFRPLSRRASAPHRGGGRGSDPVSSVGLEKLSPCRGGTFQIDRDEPVTIDARGGELAVLSGQVWLTRSRDPVDYVLAAGERVHIEPHRHVVVAAWDRSEWPTLAWQPDPSDATRHFAVRDLRADVFAGALRGLAWVASTAAAGLRRGEAGFAVLARSAASSASRAQGCI